MQLIMEVLRGLIFMNSSSNISCQGVMEVLRGLIFMNSSSNISCQGISDEEDVFEDCFEMFVEENNIMCEICMEDKQRQEMFINIDNPCPHTFCIECISRHAKAKVEENITVITCPEPNCKSTLELLSCQGIIAEDVFKMWGTALFRSLCSGSKSVNCPFEDCSEMFLEEEGGSVTATECPFCHRLFCAQCKVSWHSDMQCQDFHREIKNNKMTMAQKVVSWLHVGTKQRSQAIAAYKQRTQVLNDDQVFLDLAKKKKWRKCPNCKIYVQKAEGCLHITCRCKSQFCYRCGSKWSSSHTCKLKF